MTTKQFHIPHLNERIVLAQDWTFNLYAESRNESMVDNLAPKPKGGDTRFLYYGKPTRKEVEAMEIAGWTVEFAGVSGYVSDVRIPFTIPKGAELAVARIYIRNGQKEFDSVTFRWLNGPRKNLRFWAKLDDVNNIVME